MKNKIWLFATPIGILFLTYIILKVIVFPIATDYANDQLSKISNLNEFAEIQFEKVDFEVFDPRVKIKNIKVKTKKTLNNILKNFDIQEVDLKINVFDLLIGKLNFNILSVNELKLDVELDPILEQPKSNTEFNINQIYEILNLVPIQRFKIDNLSLNLHSEKQKINFKINESLIRTSYLDSKLLVRLNIKNSAIKNEKNQASVPLEVDLNLLFSKANVLVREIQLKVKDNLVKAEGMVEDVNQLNTNAVGQLTVSAITDLQEVKNILEQFSLLSLKEKLEGRVTLAGSLAFRGMQSIDGNINLNSENIVFDKFDFGTAIIRSEFKKDRVKFSNIELIHPAGKVTLSESSVKLKEPHEFKAKVASEHLDLQKLFLSLDLKEVPVFLALSPKVECEGAIKGFSIFCKASAKGFGLKVQSEMRDPSSRIVEIGEFGVSGEFFSDLDKIAYKGIVTVNDNSVESEGVVDYVKGFEIKFKSPKVDFKNVVSLANLDFKGSLAIDGSTKGDSHAATFVMKTSGTDFRLEQYNFGNLETQLSYHDGTLTLAELKGQVNESKYSGHIDLKLRDSEIQGEVNFDSAKLKDILTITQGVVAIPFHIDGMGSAKVKMNGPLDFWKLNYNLVADFKDVRIHTEHFTDLNVNINAEKGTSVFTNNVLSKKNSRLTVEGTLNSDKTFNLKGTGQGFRLEDSGFVKGLGVPVFGDVGFNYSTKGFISDPKLELQFHSPEVLIGDKQLEGSDIKLALDKHAMEWDMKLFNQKLNAIVRWPFAAHHSKVILKSKFNNFDHTVLFPLIGAESLQGDYVGNLTGETSLTASNTQLSDLDGKITIDDLSIQRGNLKLSLAEKSTIECDKGAFTISELKLAGPDNIIELSGENFTFDQLNVRVSAKSDLRILHFLTPFLEEISGPFELGARISGQMKAPRILGQAVVKDSYVKIKNFPHPFEKINTMLVFSQSKIFIQNLRSSFAGGLAKADGQIEILGPKNVPLFLNIKAESVNLNIPDKVRTSGSANLTLSGKWFPFLIAGNYNVTGGIFEKELGGDESGPTTKQSIYLPKSLKEKGFDPLALEVNVFLENKYLVKNSLVDGYANGNIQLRGPLSNILIFGKIDLEKGTRLYFKDKVFDLTSGMLNFNNPTEINPEVYVTASARVNNYDINILAQGPAKAANIKMSSSPPLAENEIISLLALGITSSQLEQNVQSRAQAEQTGIEIGAQLLAQTGFSKGVKNTLGLDLQLVNQYDSTRNVNVSKATVSRKITNKVQASASRDLGADPATEVKIQYFFNNNVSAIGNWEGREFVENENRDRQSQSVFGLDLEFKREFR